MPAETKDTKDGADILPSTEANDATVTQPSQSASHEPEVDEFGLPLRKPRRRLPIADDVDDTDDDDFVDAPSREKSVDSSVTREREREREGGIVGKAVKTIEDKVRREREVSVEVETRTRERSVSVARSRTRSESVAKVPTDELEVTHHEDEPFSAPVAIAITEHGDETKTPTTPMPKLETSQPAKEAEGPALEKEEPATLNDIADRPRDNEPTSPTSATSPKRKSIRHSVPKASEWSHMNTLKSDDAEEEDELEWQTMPAYAPFDIYDDDNKLIAREAHDYEDDMMQYGALGGAGKGYTRVQLDEDVQSQTSLDDNTAYLFKDSGRGTAMMEEDDGDPRDAIGQMQATKELLTEGQRIAYVGTVRLTMIEMHKEVESLERTKKAKKAVEFAAASLLMWSQKVMLKLYAHMEIGQDEQIMIEQLAEHGVQAADLVPALMINARVKNPVQEESKENGKLEEITEEPSEIEDADDKEKKDDTARDPKSSSHRPSISSRLSESSSKFSITSTFTNLKESVASPKQQSSSHVDSSASSPDLRKSSGPLSPPLPSPSVAPSSPGYMYDQHTPKTPTLPAVKSPEEISNVKNLEIDIRWTVLCDLFLLLIADSTYDSRSRRLLELVGERLQVSWLEICRFEKRVTDALEMQEAADKENWNEDDHMATRQKEARNRRLIVMGLATVGGGLVIGLSAGLLAPVIGAGLAAGFTTIGVAGTSGFLAGAGGAAIVTTTGVVTGGTIGVRAANRRTGAVKTFEYRPLHNNKRTNLIITIAGWMNGKVDDVRLPFSTVDPIMGDIYSIYWEPEMLQSMGQTISILATEALTQTLQQVLGSTVLIALMAALQLPVLLTKLAYLIDNPWNVSLARADLAGLILADSLVDRNLGARPITLVGFSLGARVIYSCLRELAKKGQTGLIQNVYIFGTPVIANKHEFLKCRTVVAGRFLNGYATNDWILAYLFRITGGGIAKVAGLTAIDDVPTIENVNVTELVPGHMSYRAAMPRLMRHVGWEVESDEFTEIEDPDPENHEKRQRELINEIEEARKQLEEKQSEKKGGKWGFWKKKKVEKKEWEMYDERSKQAPVINEEAELDEKALEKRADGVLFDIDAIRQEVKELAGQEIEVKQLESTLPPMKIDMKASTTPEPTPTLRSSKSFNDSPSMASKSSPALTPRTGQRSTFGTPETGGKSSFGDDAAGFESLSRPEYERNGHVEEEITMSFELPSQPSQYHEMRSSTSERPQLRSHATEPVPPPPPPKDVNWNPDYNAWNDEDEDFGKEQEITMTFG